MKSVAANLSSSFGQFYKTSVLSMVDFSSSPSRLNNTNGSYSSSSGGSQFKKIKRFFKNSPYIPFIVVFVIVILIAGVFLTRAMKSNQATQIAGATAQNKQVNVAKPLAQETL